ncbi:hypothetical protein C2G38_893250 [Gigaspora rosea]|uniref:Uncharacterized protein n=1 Tax=Gigaspora rosea TaxID=44941 RepID=A0A397VT69_9GLOM|nr:hypothetical protein C2G38_893250 [Gigaspora rosea]
MLSSIVKWFVAKQSSRSSIEIIVFCLIIASFTYASLFRSPTESDFFNLQEIDFVQVISYLNTNEFVFLSKPDSISQASRIRLNQDILKTQLEEPITSILPHQPTNVQKRLESLARFQEVVEKEIYIDRMNKLYYNDDLCYKFPGDSLFFSLTSVALIANVTKPFCQPSSFGSLADFNCGYSVVTLNYVLNVNGSCSAYADAWLTNLCTTFIPIMRFF